MMKEGSGMWSGKFVALAVGAFEVAGGVGHWCETVLGVEGVRIARHEAEAAEPLKGGVLEDVLHEEFGMAAGAVRGENEDIAEVRERGVIGDNAREADERWEVWIGYAWPFAVVHAEAEGVIDGALDTLTRDAR